MSKDQNFWAEATILEDRYRTFYIIKWLPSGHVTALLYLNLSQVIFWFALIQPIRAIELNAHMPLSLHHAMHLQLLQSFDLSSNFKSLVHFANLGSLDCSSADEFLARTQVISKTFWTHFQLHLITYQSVTFRSLKQLQNQLAVTQCRHKIYLPSIWRALRLNWWLSGWVTTFLIHLAGSQTEGGHLAPEFRTNERPCLPYAHHRPQPSPATSLQHIAVYVFLSFLNSWRGAVLIPSTATHSDD